MENSQKLKDFYCKISALLDVEYSLIEPHIKVLNFKKKDFFLTEGKVCKSIGFVNSGAFRMFYKQKEKEINTTFFLENNFVFDLNSFLNQKPSKYSIQALENTELIVFDYEFLHNTCIESYKWERFARMVAEKAYLNMERRVENLLNLDGKQRYLQTLTSQPTIFKKVPLYHIASYLGLERESLSRLRKKIARK